MSARPGQQARTGGCFIIVLFGIFAVAGLMIVITGPDVHKDRESIVIGALFGLIGIVGMIGGMLVLRRANTAALAAKASNAGWEQSRCFPKRTSTPSPRGTYILKPPVGPVLAAIMLTIGTGIFGTLTYFMFTAMKVPLVMPWIFGAITALLLYSLVRQVMVLLFSGHTSVELNADPVVAGQAATLTLYQSGNFAINRAAVRLVCDEVCSYQAGKNRATVEKEAYSVEVLDQTAMHARDRLPIATVDVAIPATVMHSFKANNNEIRWSFEVVLDLPGRPDVKQKFEFRVAPPQGSEGWAG